MNRLQYLLTKLAEEASEVAQIALKTQQFGLEEICPNLPYTNKERIYQELDDLNGVLEMLALEFDFQYIVNRKAIMAKIGKVNKYYGYSKQLKQVE
jgi:NTP pyrophosphatase (non-canonical NTP hydrolase)